MLVELVVNMLARAYPPVDASMIWFKVFEDGGIVARSVPELCGKAGRAVSGGGDSADDGRGLRLIDGE